MKPSLRPGARSALQAGQGSDSGGGPPTPGALELDEVGPRRSRHAAGAASLHAAAEPKTPTEAPQVPEAALAPEVELPPARDSFEAAIRMLRQAWRDTVRSLTGNRGIKAVKEELRLRLADGRAEAKEAAKFALQAGKDAVKQNVLDEKGRKELQEQVRKHGKIGLRRHWRLAVVVFILWGLLIGAGKACHMLCADAAPRVPRCASCPAPPPPPRPRTAADLKVAGAIDSGGRRGAPRRRPPAPAARAPTHHPAPSSGGAPPPRRPPRAARRGSRQAPGRPAPARQEGERLRSRHQPLHPGDRRRSVLERRARRADRARACYWPRVTSSAPSATSSRSSAAPMWMR